MSQSKTLTQPAYQHWHWHTRHREQSKPGDLIADRIVVFIGSWKFVFIQSGIFALWVVLNTLWLLEPWRWDPYPFILFNLFMSAEAAYATPLILMAQNRQSDRDRLHAQHDFEVNVQAKQEIEELMKSLNRIEAEKLDRIIELQLKVAGAS